MHPSQALCLRGINASKMRLLSFSFCSHPLLSFNTWRPKLEKQFRAGAADHEFWKKKGLIEIEDWGVRKRAQSSNKRMHPSHKSECGRSFYFRLNCRIANVVQSTGLYWWRHFICPTFHLSCQATGCTTCLAALVTPIRPFSSGCPLICHEANSSTALPQILHC